MTWFSAGLIIGLAGAVTLFYMGYLPAPPTAPEREPVPGSTTGPELLDDADGIAGDAVEPRYDFFTVLPEMEVVVPEQELADLSEAEPDSEPLAPSGEGQYILQAGSFRSSEDADQRKARLALLGSVANVQRVTVNEETWHRVRIGPVQGARQADEVRRRLMDNGIDVLVLKVNP
jgi:hypothetical protein